MRRIFLIFAIASFSLLMACSNQTINWEPVADGMLTRWATQVDPRNPLPEYPRPQMMREDWVNLNGLWNYAVTPKEATASEINDGEILVPFAIESAMSGVKRTFLPTEKLWYKRTFSIPSSWKKKRVMLNFGAVDYDCVVKINDKIVGGHTGGNCAFSFDITDHLTSNKNQTIVVEVTDPTDQGRQPRGKQVLEPKGIHYTAVSGIWKTVWLEPVAETYLERYIAVPDIDNSALHVKSFVVNGENDVKVKFTAFEGKRKVSEVVAAANEDAVLEIPNVRLWDTDSPFLYDLKVEVLKDGKVKDEVDSYFGMRKISVEKDERGLPRIMLNNKFVFQYGFLDQGWWPDGLLTAPTDEALLYDIEFTKNAGYNTIRKHIKIESDRFYYHCDRLGLLVWQDAVSGDFFNLKNHNQDNTKTAEAAAQFELELQEMIDQLYNYPSIVNWVVFNEGWGQYGGKKWIEWTKRYDPSRLAEVSGWVDFGNGDVIDVHRYPGPGRVESHGDERAFALGEFGGLGHPVIGHLWNPEMRNWGYATYEDKQEFVDVYKHMIFHLRTMIPEGLSAAIYTQTTDVEGEVNGMLTYDREVQKISEKELYELHSGLYSAPVELATIMANSDVESQKWSYTFKEPQEGWAKATSSPNGWIVGDGFFGNLHPDWQLGFSLLERTSAKSHYPTTKWETKDIWLWKEFDVNQIPEFPLVRIKYDTKVEVFINGVEIADIDNRLAHYYHSDLVRFDKEILKEGKNTIAIHAHHPRFPKRALNQFIDAEIVSSNE